MRKPHFSGLTLQICRDSGIGTTKSGKQRTPDRRPYSRYHALIGSTCRTTFDLSTRLRYIACNPHRPSCSIKSIVDSIYRGTP